MSKQEFYSEDQKVDAEKLEGSLHLAEESEVQNSVIEAVRLVVPITDDPTLIAVTFRFWIISTFFSIIGAIVQQYYFYRVVQGNFSAFFVTLASYYMGKGMARILPTGSFSIAGYSMSLNPGPFNIKEHALIGIASSTAANAAYAIDILSATDLFLEHRVGAVGSLLLIITTQCVGYGMAGVLRKYLVYPAEMVWWSNLVQVVLYNAMHNTEEFVNQKMIRGWSYMKYFWVFCGGMFLWELIPQWLAPTLLYFPWLCWIKPFNFDFWALFGTDINSGGIMALSFDWTSINGLAMYYPLAAQLCNWGGAVLNYWILLPIMWLTNTLGTKTIGLPLTSRLFYTNGSSFNIHKVLNADYSLNEELYDSGEPAYMAPMYALVFMTSFIALAGCVSHIVCFHGKDIWRNWKQAVVGVDADVHTKMMQIYPEVPQLWYAIFYVIMAALSIVLICGFMLPGKPIANMVFKCYGYMAMIQCQQLLSDLKLGHYMKIPPRSMFVAQFWGTIVGGVFNYITMILIINSQREYLDGSKTDPTGLWTGQRALTFWGSGLIYGALGPARMFAIDGKYGFVYLGFLIGFILPVILWILSKKFPHIPWSKFNVSIIAGGMSLFPNGYALGVLPSLITIFVFQYYIFRYHKGWWKKYVFILSAALDTGAAFTGLVMFLFLGGGISPKIIVNVPSWWGNPIAPDGSNAPWMNVGRCGDANQTWAQGGTLPK
ncbi:hypothetical protein BGZ83_001725 [Gryganskiella cystojenkinii]|nr:hypothetical protein BGZ83_001725 [Gryganskiella cystojenkinii]